MENDSFSKKYLYGINYMYIKNGIINILLLIFSGIIYLLYYKYITGLYVDNWPPIFLGIVVIFIIIFCNMIGLLLSIIRIKKTYLTIIVYMLLIISTIFVYSFISVIVKTLENKKIISECSSIIFIGIIMIIENIMSYYIIKKITRIK
jgi:hypothetical protein